MGFTGGMYTFLRGSLPRFEPFSFFCFLSLGICGSSSSPEAAAAFLACFLRVADDAEDFPFAIASSGRNAATNERRCVLRNTRRGGWPLRNLNYELKAEARSESDLDCITGVAEVHLRGLIGVPTLTRQRHRQHSQVVVFGEKQPYS